MLQQEFKIPYALFFVGLFAYSCGCIVIIEDLTTGKQRHLRYHAEEISTLAVHHDGQVIASASSPGPSANSNQICIWEVGTGLCRKVRAIPYVIKLVKIETHTYQVTYVNCS